MYKGVYYSLLVTSFYWCDGEDTREPEILSNPLFFARLFSVFVTHEPRVTLPAGDPSLAVSASARRGSPAAILSSLLSYATTPDS